LKEDQRCRKKAAGSSCAKYINGKTQGKRLLSRRNRKIDPNERDGFFRVCAYCRVSTDNDEQLSSFELQQARYRQLVQEHPNWELKHIFTDQGTSGTSLKNRDSFNEMIEACKRGEYDLIVIKSVSRSARNLVDAFRLSACSKA